MSPSLLPPRFFAKRRAALLVSALSLGLAAALMVGVHPQSSIADAAAVATPPTAAARPATSDVERAWAERAQLPRTAEPAPIVASDETGPDDLPPRRRTSPIPAPVAVAASAQAPEAAAPPAAAPPAAAPPVSLVALPLLYADVWNANERYFAISGASPEQLIASAKASIPADPHGALHNAVAYSGPVVWDHVPSYVVDQASGACTMTGVDSTVVYNATMPQWTSPSQVAPELVAWWQLVLEQIRQHEGHHISIYSDFVAAFPARVAGQSCDAWVSIANQWSADLTATHAAFDAAEAAWVFPPYAGRP